MIWMLPMCTTHTPTETYTAKIYTVDVVKNIIDTTKHHIDKNGLCIIFGSSISHFHHPRHAVQYFPSSLRTYMYL